MDMQMPEIYCAVKLVFDKDINIDAVIEKLNKIGINEFRIKRPKYEKAVCIILDGVKYERLWYLDEALNIMFSHIDDKLIQIRDIVDCFHGEVILDISFWHYESYPALVFSHENINKIHLLNASISIDPY